jgi:regulator of nucleoside diphosphate kinase
MADQIFISESEIDRLRAVVDQSLEGRDAVTAERLGAELDRAIVVPPAALPADVATVESRVAYEDESTGAAREVTLAYPSAADASSGRVSVLAPVGAALLGLRVGDRIEWPLPDGRTARIRIRAVAQPTAPGASPSAPGASPSAA